MKIKLITALTVALFASSMVSHACSMYKLTQGGKTIVGNNEDWLSPNSQFWFEVGEENKYGVMYMGLLNSFAQGAINEAGLVFDGFANPYLAIENTEGKLAVPIGDAIKNIMQTMAMVEEVKAYLETIDLSSLTSSQVVFVDKSGTYLIVEGDELIISEEVEKLFSNFYYSQVVSEEEVEIANFQKGLQFVKTTESEPSLDYGSRVMEELSNVGLSSTQYSTIYDLNALVIRVYLFHDYTQFIELDLKKELAQGERSVMIADLFPEASIGRQYYHKYNDEVHPTRILEEAVGEQELSEAEFIEMDFNYVINIIGYEWLQEIKNPMAAIKIFQYGTELMPNNADLYDSLGEAYFEDKDWDNSIMNYARSLSLDPQNENAIEMIIKAHENRGEGGD
ncbi:hypothetical protein [Lewinella cohaerens]|uniref:hypothetical protein n=1 Tax=Lewinella cohaerens TaxID=70995 RepID=UPI000368F95C|nr:hypothetical protein [Lewinella cohaerens]